MAVAFATLALMSVALVVVGGRAISDAFARSAGPEALVHGHGEIDAD